MACLLAPQFEREERNRRSQPPVMYCSLQSHKSQALHELGLILGVAQAYCRRDMRLSQLKHSYHLLSRRYHVSRDQLLRVDSEIDDGKRQMVEYEHQIREWLSRYSGVLDPDQVEGWFAYTAGDERWARHFINGIIGEVALWKLLQHLPEVAEVSFTEVGEDVRGADLLVQMRQNGGLGSLVAIDVKTIFRDMTPEEIFHPTGYTLTLPDGNVVDRVEVGIPRSKVLYGFFLHEWDVARQLDLLEKFADRK